MLNHPIDPSQLTKMPFGYRSYWLQPWRSTLTTRPAASFEDALGINFNVPASAAQATARLLSDSGVHRARLELPWIGMSYADPSRIADPNAWGAYIRAFHQYGIRPLILLNANSGAPGPERPVQLRLRNAAAVGAKRVRLTAASARVVHPGLTGFNADGNAAGVLITHIAGGVASLSRPLPTPLPAHRAIASTTLRYQPFGSPKLADGKPNPQFEQTMSGWLTYVRSVCHFVRGIYGSDDFDVEVWNELGFGSDFLNRAAYYSSSLHPAHVSANLTAVTGALLLRTIAMLRDPRSGLTHVQVGDGFSNQVPWVSGTTVPSGTNGIDRHPYAGPVDVPGTPTEGGIKPLERAGQARVPHVRRVECSATCSRPTFGSSCRSTGSPASQTETIMRDLSPLQSSIYGTPHGAGTHPPGAPPPRVWITEDNLDAASAVKNGVPTRDIPEFQAKAALRFYVAYGSEGAQAIDLYGAQGAPCCQLVSPTFFRDVAAGRVPADPERVAGRPLQAVRRLTSDLSGAQPIARAAPARARRHRLGQQSRRTVRWQRDRGLPVAVQPRRPGVLPLPDRPEHVRLRGVCHDQRSDAPLHLTPSSGPDALRPPCRALPPDDRQREGSPRRGSRSPIHSPGKRDPVRIVSRHGDEIVVQLRAADSPRMLRISDA